MVEYGGGSFWVSFFCFIIVWGCFLYLSRVCVFRYGVFVFYFVLLRSFRSGLVNIKELFLFWFYSYLVFWVVVYGKYKLVDFEEASVSIWLVEVDGIYSSFIGFLDLFLGDFEG